MFFHSIRSFVLFVIQILLGDYPYLVNLWKEPRSYDNLEVKNNQWNQGEKAHVYYTNRRSNEATTDS
jgi:hypothetical protein